MKLPSFSIITPSLNQGAYISDAIESVAAQGDFPFEHIVIDAVSSDETAGIVARYPHVRWTSERDRGQSDAINKGFLRATGDFVAWLNADDFYLPGAFKAVAAVAERHPEVDIFFGDCAFVDRAGGLERIKKEHRFDPQILMYYGCYIPSTSTFFRRRIIQEGLLLDCDYRICMDLEFFARLHTLGKRFLYIDTVLAAFRWQGENASLQHERRAAEKMRIQARFGAKLPAFGYRVLFHTACAKRVLRKVCDGAYAYESFSKRHAGLDMRWFASTTSGHTVEQTLENTR